LPKVCCAVIVFDAAVTPVPVIVMVTASDFIARSDETHRGEAVTVIAWSNAQGGGSRGR